MRSEMILLSSGGASTQRRATRSDELLVGSTEGVYRFRRGARGDWRLEGHALEGVSVSALAADEGGRIYAATHGLGMAVSDDGGAAWRYSARGLDQLDLWVVKVERLFGRETVFTGSLPAHLYASRDRGEAWTELAGLRRTPSAPAWSFPPPPYVAHVLDIAALNDRLYVGIEVGALLTSDDGGESFSELPVNPEPSEVDIHRIGLHPARPDRLLVVTGWGPLISEDGGATWGPGGELPKIDYPIPLVIHPDDPDLIFTAGGEGWPPQWYGRGRSLAKIARSRDGGRHWERLLGGLPDGQRATYSALSLESFEGGFNLFAADTDGQMFESLDGGDRWRIIGETAPVSKGDQHRGLAKGRPRLAGVDDLVFRGPALERLRAASA